MRDSRGGIQRDVHVALEHVRRVVDVRSAVLVTARGDGSLRAYCLRRPSSRLARRAVDCAVQAAEGLHPSVLDVVEDGTIVEAVTLRPPAGFEDAFEVLQLGMVAPSARELELLDDVATAIARAAVRRRRASSAERDEGASVLLTVAHDLKNPLAVISLASDLLAERDCDRDSRELGMIRRAAARAQRLVGDLLDEARTRAGAVSVDVAACPISEPIVDVVETSRVLAEAKHVELSARVPRDLPLVEADADRVVQVLTNLVGNAIKFTGPGGRVEIAASAREHDVEVTVRDSGVGIPANMLDTIFDPFVRAHATTHVGTGLGLTIARDLVRAQHGRIRVTSDPGAGSTFAFTLPIAEGALHAS